jgi:hypothetical protein
VTIPPLPSVKVLYSYAQFTEARSVTWAWNGESRGQPSPIRPICETTLKALFTAASLLLIQLPGQHDKERPVPTSEQEWNYWGSKSCFKAHDRGVLIRTYIHPTTKEVFTHCRSYAAHHSHIDEGIIHRSEDVWEEHVDYQGLVAPAGVLGMVYKKMGKEAGWRVPGRGLEMNEEAWNVLRKWVKLRDNLLGRMDGPFWAYWADRGPRVQEL